MNFYYFLISTLVITLEASKNRLGVYYSSNIPPCFYCEGDTIEDLNFTSTSELICRDESSNLTLSYVSPESKPLCSYDEVENFPSRSVVRVFKLTKEQPVIPKFTKDYEVLAILDPEKLLKTFDDVHLVITYTPNKKQVKIVSPEDFAQLSDSSPSERPTIRTLLSTTTLESTTALELTTTLDPTTKLNPTTKLDTTIKLTRKRSTIVTMEKEWKKNKMPILNNPIISKSLGNSNEKNVKPRWKHKNESSLNEKVKDEGLSINDILKMGRFNFSAENDIFILITQSSVLTLSNAYVKNTWITNSIRNTIRKLMWNLIRDLPKKHIEVAIGTLGQNINKKFEIDIHFSIRTRRSRLSSQYPDIFHTKHQLERLMNAKNFTDVYQRSLRSSIALESIALKPAVAMAWTVRIKNTEHQIFPIHKWFIVGCCALMGLLMAIMLSYRYRHQIRMKWLKTRKEVKKMFKRRKWSVLAKQSANTPDISKFNRRTTGSDPKNFTEVDEAEFEEYGKFFGPFGHRVNFARNRYYDIPESTVGSTELSVLYSGSDRTGRTRDRNRLSRNKSKESIKHKVSTSKSKADARKSKIEMEPRTETRRARSEPVVEIVRPRGESSRPRGESSRQRVESRPETSRSRADASRYRVESSKSREDTRSRVEPSKSKVETSKSKLEQSGSKVERSKSRVETSKTKVEPSRSRVEAGRSRTEQSKTKLEGSKSRVEKSRSRVEPARSRTEGRIDQSRSRTEGRVDQSRSRTEGRVDQSKSRTEYRPERKVEPSKSRDISLKGQNKNKVIFSAPQNESSTRMDSNKQGSSRSRTRH